MKKISIGNNCGYFHIVDYFYSNSFCLYSMRCALCISNKKFIIIHYF